ncbi:MAG: hypothetical protein AAF249_01825 [Pseudomonadota bacterium]
MTRKSTPFFCALAIVRPSRAGGLVTTTGRKSPRQSLHAAAVACGSVSTTQLSKPFCAACVAM